MRARVGAWRIFRCRSWLKSKWTMEMKLWRVVSACFARLADGLPRGGLIPASVKG